jgi:hypothetical protein
MERSLEVTASARLRSAAFAAPYRYCAYGVVVDSDMPLPLPGRHGESLRSLGYVQIRTAPASAFSAAAEHARDAGHHVDDWHRYAELPDGSTYVWWGAVGEFVVTADGRGVICRQVEGSSLESFQVYLLGQALSFALVQQRLEPLHAAAVVVDGRAIGFLGSNGFGKSTLAACFLEAGYGLLTDDVLTLQESSGHVLAFPGPPRIKLFSRTARRFLSHNGDRGPMNAGTDKLIVPLDGRCACETPVPLAGLYSLTAPRHACRRDDVAIATMSPRDAFAELVKATFNRRLATPIRLARQFELMTGLARAVPVRQLTYARTFDRLEDVRDVVLADLASRSVPTPARVLHASGRP